MRFTSTNPVLRPLYRYDNAPATPSPHTWFAERHRNTWLVRIVAHAILLGDATLRSVAQVVFTSHPLTGLVILAALLATASQPSEHLALVGSVAAAATAVAASAVCGADGHARQFGLHGYPSVLTALALLSTGCLGDTCHVLSLLTTIFLAGLVPLLLQLALTRLLVGWFRLPPATLAFVFATLLLGAAHPPSSRTSLSHSEASLVGVVPGAALWDQSPDQGWLSDDAPEVARSGGPGVGDSSYLLTIVNGSLADVGNGSLVGQLTVQATDSNRVAVNTDLRDEPPLLRFLGGTARGVSQIFLVASAPAGIGIVVAVALSSRLLALALLFGSATGYLVGAALGASVASLHAGLFGFNPALTAGAASLFFVPSRSLLPVTFVAIVTTLVLQQGFLVPTYTLPFCLATLVLLLAGDEVKSLQVVEVSQAVTPEVNWMRALQQREAAAAAAAVAATAACDAAASAPDNADDARRVEEGAASVGGARHSRVGGSGTLRGGSAGATTAPPSAGDGVQAAVDVGFWADENAVLDPGPSVRSAFAGTSDPLLLGTVRRQRRSMRPPPSAQSQEQQQQQQQQLDDDDGALSPATGMRSLGGMPPDPGDRRAGPTAAPTLAPP